MEKQTMNAIKQIWKFNDEAGLTKLGYDDVRECAYPIEEMLEGFDIVKGFSVGKGTPKEMSREILHNLGSFTGTDVDRLDKHLDAIVFNFGSICKMGLTAQQAVKALGIVMDANMQKLKAGQDSAGKQKKPDDFKGPEEQLQKLLDKR